MFRQTCTFSVADTGAKLPWQEKLDTCFGFWSCFPSDTLLSTWTDLALSWESWTGCSPEVPPATVFLWLWSFPVVFLSYRPCYEFERVAVETKHLLLLLYRPNWGEKIEPSTTAGDLLWVTTVTTKRADQRSQGWGCLHQPLHQQRATTAEQRASYIEIHSTQPRIKLIPNRNLLLDYRTCSTLHNWELPWDKILSSVGKKKYALWFNVCKCKQTKPNHSKIKHILWCQDINSWIGI